MVAVASGERVQATSDTRHGLAGEVSAFEGFPMIGDGGPAPSRMVVILLVGIAAVADDTGPDGRRPTDT